MNRLVDTTEAMKDMSSLLNTISRISKIPVRISMKAEIYDQGRENMQEIHRLTVQTRDGESGSWRRKFDLARAGLDVA